MFIVFCVAAAAALTVVAYTSLRQHAPQAGATGLRAVRELAAIVLVCSKAVEGVVDVLAGSRRPAPSTGWTGSYDPDPFDDTY